MKIVKKNKKNKPRMLWSTDFKQMRDDDTTIWKSLLCVCFGSSWPCVFELQFTSSHFSWWLFLELITLAGRHSCFPTLLLK